MSPEELKQSVIGHFFNFIFNLLYNQFAWAYDLVAWVVSGGLWKKWVFSILQDLPNSGRVLELGFGPGHLQTQGLLANKNMYGVDISRNMVIRCAKRLSEANLPSYISQADSTKLPFESGAFSSVIATFPAPYIFQTNTLDEINRVLKNDGVFVVIPTAWSTSKAPLQRFFSWLFNLSANSTNPPEATVSAINERLEQSNFNASHKTVDVKKSKVLFISGIKQEPSDK